MRAILEKVLMLLLAPLALSAVPARFAVFGDYGYAAGTYEAQVAAMVNSWNVDFIVTTGDNSYGSAAIDANIGQFYSNYIGDYTGAYGAGAPVNRFFPSIGNHDYTDGGGINAYLNYFTLPGTGIATTNTSGNERYYDFTIGPVQFFLINCFLLEPDGTAANSAQAAWLREQMVASTVPWQIVVMHYPPYSSSQHGSSPGMQWPYEAWGADAVFTGHDHTYERIMRDDNSDGDSLAYFVSGLGGRSLYTFGAPVDGSAVRYNAHYGSMLVEATDSTLWLKFFSLMGAPEFLLVDSLLIQREPTCCAGGRGNVDCDTAHSVDVSDLTALIDNLFLSFTMLCCVEEADCDSSGGVDIGDLTALIDRLFVNFGILAPCP